MTYTNAKQPTTTCVVMIPVADSGRGPGPPFGKAKNLKRVQLTENSWYSPPPHCIAPAFGGPGKGKCCYYPPPTQPRRLSETTEKTNSATTPPPHSIASAFGDHGTKILLRTTPPPTESRRLGTSHERGRPFRKILDLRLDTLHIPRVNSTTYGLHSSAYLGAKVWNCLPQTIKGAVTLSTFKALQSWYGETYMCIVQSVLI